MSTKWNGRVFALGLAGIVGLSGCATMDKIAEDTNATKLIDGNVLRMRVIRDEDPNEALIMPLIRRSQTHWSEVDNQYRWVRTMAGLGGWGGTFSMAMPLIPDQLPLLKKLDLVDVWIHPIDEGDFSQLKVPVILRIVCRYNDVACVEALKKQNGVVNGVVSQGKPDMSGLTFSKKFDLNGKLLAQP